MEYISYGKNDRYMTRMLEEYANSFCSEMGFKRITDKGIFRVLRHCEDKIMCYRFIDETLKKDLENLQGDFSEMVLKEHWFISAMQRDENGNSYIFALYNSIAETVAMKDYIYYQVNGFFKNLLSLVKKKNGDTNIFIMDMIYEDAIAYVDRKISNTINMAMSPRVILAENISQISYLPYEGNKVNNKYMVWGVKKEACDIVFKDNDIFLHNHKKIRKLLEITYKDKNSGLYLVCCEDKVEGYISPENLKGEVSLVEFNGTGKWSFCCPGNDKIIFENRKVRIFKDDDKKNFCLCYEKIFQTDAEEIWPIVESAKRQKHGTMLLFTENAPMESIRLSKAGYQVAVNGTMNNRWIKALGEIDGAMFLDQYGKLYMIGVILDGEMSPEGGSTDRGARYNSAVKYSYSHKAEKHLIVVISEDGDVNMINYNYL